MFGYVRPYRPSLTLGDYTFYRAVYCGVCRSMKRLTGSFSSLSLNYDLVFLALVRLLVGEHRVKLLPCRCAVHPWRKRAMLVEDPAADYAARVNALLVYHKLRDDLNDHRAFGRIPPAAALPVFSHARKRAGLAELDEKIAMRLSQLGEAERARVASIDTPAELFGQLLGDIFAYDAPDAFAEPLYTLGVTLGKFIYAADAADDFEEDLRNKNYNPYLLTYGDTLSQDARLDIHDALLCTLAEGEAAWQALPFGESKTVRRLIENILWEGLPHRIDFLITGEKKPRRTPAPYEGDLP